MGSPNELHLLPGSYLVHYCIHHSFQRVMRELLGDIWMVVRQPLRYALAAQQAAQLSMFEGRTAKLRS